MASEQKHPLIALFMIALGVYFVLVGFQLVVANGVHVPLWVMAFLGLLFVLCGVFLIKRESVSKNNWLVSLTLLCFSMIGFGIGFFQESSTLSKWIFGISSTICFLLSLVVITQSEKKEKSHE